MITLKERQMLEAHLLGLGRAQYLCLDHTIAPVKQQQLNAMIARREAGEPIAKIINRKAFWLGEFFTNEHTLDPRSESELIIETVLKLHPDQSAHLKILDLGTGTGCLLLSLLREYPNASGVGIDTSLDAIKVARFNATALKLQNQSIFYNLSWTELDVSLYNVIVTNPPYIPTKDIAQLECDVRDYDPIQALDGGDDGLDAYKQIFKLSFHADGIIICEIGINQHEDVREIAKNAGFTQLDASCDLSGIMRVLAFGKNKII